MNKKPVLVWIIISIVMLVMGRIWSNSDPENYVAFFLYFFGWLSSLLAVGYYSTPSNSRYGKIAFGFVIIMVAGIAFKLLHYTGANELIIVGLLGVLITYVTIWFRQKKDAK